jgi:hypothetical protein
MRKPRAIVVTDRAILLLRMKKLTTKAEKLIILLPRDTRFGPVPGSFTWAKVELLHENLFVSGRFRKDIEAANAGIREGRLDN